MEKEKILIESINDCFHWFLEFRSLFMQQYLIDIQHENNSAFNYQRIKSPERKLIRCQYEKTDWSFHFPRTKNLFVLMNFLCIIVNSLVFILIWITLIVKSFHFNWFLLKTTTYSAALFAWIEFSRSMRLITKSLF